MKKFSLSITLGHGQCQNQCFALFPLPSKAITGQGSVRLRRYKTACCSRLSRSQAGSALVVPESALTFIWAIPLPSIQVLPSSPACSLLKEEYPISSLLNLQKNEMNLFLFNEFSEEEGSFICLCEAAQLSKDPGSSPVCTHVWGTGVTGCTALYSDAVTPSSGHGNCCWCWDDSIIFLLLLETC